MPSCYRTITPRDEQLPIYLCTVGHVHQNPMVYPNGAPHYHWLHTVNGSGTVVFQGETRTLSPGTGFFMYPHMPARYWPDTHPWEVMWITFDGHSLDRFLQAWGMEPGFIELVDLPYLCNKVSDLLTRAGEEADYT